MKLLIFTLTAIAGIFIVSCNSTSSQAHFKSEKESVTVSEASAMLTENTLLIDVREPEEIAEQSFDVKNCIHIPLGTLESKIKSIPQDKQVIVACRSGKRSQEAFDLLKTNGFTNIANLEGGMNAWSEAGLPTATGERVSKACCADPNSKDCNPDGTCKTKSEEKPCCSEEDKSDCAPVNSTKAAIDKSNNHLEIYAFHGTRQCETCKHMKAFTRQTLNTYFSAQLKSGSIVFSIIDVDDEANEKLAEKFQATGTALMINNVVNGKDNIMDWSDFAFEKANDESKYIPELKAMINEALKKQNGNLTSVN
ncbi:MAG: rhodanese-like domain-containing protein [Bacteroidetes bacterium]|jgi:rhodanese-related sulfurtransferase|nr:rhodanese-like domain-containing protein [Bacteroidota bacterium]